MSTLTCNCISCSVRRAATGRQTDNYYYSVPCKNDAERVCSVIVLYHLKLDYTEADTF